MQAPSAHQVHEVFDKYRKYASVKYDGEEITLLEHSLQTAQLAEKEAPTEVILSAFLHDIGHVLEVEDSRLPEDQKKIVVGKHSETGHEYLQRLGFPSILTAAALHHVNAKRYLVWKDRSYYDGLSETSKRTLMQQGGPMSKREAEEFENLDGFQCIVNVRKWDDKAKEIGRATSTIEKYEKMCVAYLAHLNKNGKH